MYIYISIACSRYTLHTTNLLLFQSQNLGLKSKHILYYNIDPSPTLLQIIRFIQSNSVHCNIISNYPLFFFQVYFDQPDKIQLTLPNWIIYHPCTKRQTIIKVPLFFWNPPPFARFSIFWFLLCHIVITIIITLAGWD